MTEAPTLQGPWFTIAGFHHAVRSLPDGLQPRVTAMRQYATSGKPHHRALRPVLAELFTLAATGAPTDELAHKATEAERLWDRLRAEAAERHRRQLQPAAPGSGQWLRAISEGHRGRVARWASTPTPLVAATDASHKGRSAGWGYVTSDGRWGLRHATYRADDPTGPAAVLVNELRAVHFLLASVDPEVPLRLLVDSKDALRLLCAWRVGDTTMPGGYDLRPRAGTEEPTLVLLARRVRQMPQLSLRGVRAHRGHPLNEAAHSLSVIARRAARSGRGFELPEEMAGMVDRFLAAWHGTGTGEGVPPRTRRPLPPSARTGSGPPANPEVR